MDQPISEPRISARHSLRLLAMYSFSCPLWFLSPRMRSYKDFSNMTATLCAKGATIHIQVIFMMSTDLRLRLRSVVPSNTNSPEDSHYISCDIYGQDMEARSVYAGG